MEERSAILIPGQGLGYVGFNTPLAGKAVYREVVIFASETKFNQAMEDKA